MGNKLLLEYIAPYLPYGVKCQYEGITNGKELKEWDIKFKSSLNSASYFDSHPQPKIIKGLKVGKIKKVSFFNDYWVAHIGIKQQGLKSFYNGSEFKLILHPISDLTSDQLIELFEIAYTQIFGSPDKSLKNFVMHGWDYNDFGLTVKDEVFVYGFSMDFEGQQDFRLSTRHISQNESPNNMLCLDKFELFQKLFEWHFDVFGLIEKGLAIEKSATELNP